MPLKAISSKPIEFIPKCQVGEPEPFAVVFKPLTKGSADAWRATMRVSVSKDDNSQNLNLSERELWTRQITQIRNFIFEGQASPTPIITGDQIIRVYDQIPRDIGDDVTAKILESGFLTENESKNSPSQSGSADSPAQAVSPVSGVD